MISKKIRRVTFWSIGAGVAVLGILTYTSYRRDLNAARARIASGSQIANTVCGAIEYATAGDGPPILLIHGAGGGWDQGLEAGHTLADSRYRLIAMSRFGYLRTPQPADTSPRAQADAHACLLDALHIPRVAVIGVSAGAPSAMQFCLRYPERCAAMVLLVPMAYAPRTAGEAQQKTSALTEFMVNTILSSDVCFWILMKLARDTVIRTILATPPVDFHNATPDEQARVLAVMRNILPISERQQGLRNEATIVPTLPRYELDRITAPTLVLTIEDDLFGSFRAGRYTAEYIPGARFVSFPTGGHLWVGHQQEFLSEITGFLGQHLPEGGSVVR